MDKYILSSENYKFLSGGQEMGQLIRSFDWSLTSLGDVDKWPQSLKSALSICLNSNFPIAIYWGKDLHLLYNDAWSSIPGNKHPGALGRPAVEVWPEIWEELQPQFAKAFEGQPGGSKDALLPMQRRGYTEECYFDFTFTPIYGEMGTVEGIFNAVIETTYRVINERRAALLNKVAKRLAQTSSCEQVYEETIDIIKDFPKDIPFAFIYTVTGQLQLKLISSTQNHIEISHLSNKTLPFTDCIDSGSTIHIKNLDWYLSGIPTGFWPETPIEGLMVPLKDNKGVVTGFLFCGLSARLQYDREYNALIENVATSINTAIQNIVSLEQERKRSETLAEIDRAKTIFFTNISHEFRTPLTLLLGPVEEFLNEPSLDSSSKTRLELVYRNALRMQKLVNTLLDFSQIEAGRRQGKYSLVDICEITADLASVFRSAIEKAGMQLQLQLAAIDGEVYVDIDMWEKIVLNLVSNAVKYTFSGIIRVEITQIASDIHISVSDTGIGIPQDHLDKLFDRFHRIENTEGRSQEGSGIGLALVKELVELHKGTIKVKSQLGSGSVFTISIPTGRAHLPQEKIINNIPLLEPTHRKAFQTEALKWISKQNPDESELSRQEPYIDPQQDKSKYKVLLADDNADMREYVFRLLSENFTVITAEDGEDAFDKMLLYKPDLLISDIMMPKLDGFGLLRKIRFHQELKTIPVIFLSARAGEESKVEGLNAGADDYLVKPFSTKELIGRVSNLIRINQIRRETEQQFYQLFLQAPSIINSFRGPEHTYELFHPKNKDIFGDVDFTGMKLRDALPELEGQGIIELMDEVYHKGIVVEKHEHLVRFVNKGGTQKDHYFTFTYLPWYDMKGEIQGVLNFANEVTNQVLAQKAIERSEENLRNIITQAPVPMCIFKGGQFVLETANERMLEFWGKSQHQVMNKPAFEGLPEVVVQGFGTQLSRVYATGERYSAIETPITLLRNGALESVYVNFVYAALKESDGQISGVMSIATDVTEQVLARHKIEQAEEKARLAIESANLGTYEVNLMSNEIRTSDRFKIIWGIPHELSRSELANRIHPHDRSIRDRANQQALATGALHYESRILWEDTSEHWVKVTGKVLYDQQGNATQLLGVTQDITDQKQFSDQLSRQVEERTLQLKRSNEDLQQFAHVASHDLREPVRKIKLFGNRLENEYANLLPEKGQIFINKIQHAADRMFSMIDGVLAYSSLNVSKQPSEKIDLNQVITDIQVDMEVLITQTAAFFKIQKLPVINGAPILIYQLFYNLINNSLKFTKANQPPVIKIYPLPVPRSSESVRIVLSDNGIGFDQEYAHKIFETFARLNGKDSFEGTGLGLSLCKKIVERHGGSISAESDIHQGAKFTITLPLNQHTCHI